MDPNALAGMAFTLVFTALIGGFILLYPLTKRLGALMESKMQAEKDARTPAQAEVRKLAESVRSLEEELRMMKERQEFTENLLTTRERQKLPPESQGA
jgi:hypothetical protein